MSVYVYNGATEHDDQWLRTIYEDQESDPWPLDKLVSDLREGGFPETIINKIIDGDKDTKFISEDGSRPMKEWEWELNCMRTLDRIMDAIFAEGDE